MNTVSKADLQNIADLYDMGDFVEIRSYSGRGMYGKSCAAIVTDRSLRDLVSFVAAVSREVHEHNASDEPVTHPLDDFLSHIDLIAEDSMGLGQVYYWPGIRLMDEDPNE